MTTGLEKQKIQKRSIEIFSKKDCLLHFVKPVCRIRTLVSAASNGSSEMAAALVTGIVTMMFNRTMLKYVGENGVAAITIIMDDLIHAMDPKYIEVWGKFLPRGGISIDPYCNYGRPGTKWEEVAWNRLANHDLYPEKVDNR